MWYICGREWMKIVSASYIKMVVMNILPCNLSAELNWLCMDTTTHLFRHAQIVL